MNRKTLLKNMEKLRQTMEKGDFAAARIIYKKLQSAVARIKLPAAEKNAMEHELAKIFAALVVETNSQAEIALAQRNLARFTSDAYSDFLIARLCWQEKKHLLAISMLEKSLNLSMQDGNIVIPKGNKFYAANAEVQGVILNLLGQGYRYFGMTREAGECYRLASEISSNFVSQTINYSNYLFSLHYLFLPPQEYLAAHKKYNELFRPIRPFAYDKKKLRQRYAARKKIRLGYISPDFRHHVVLLFIWAMLTNYSRYEFELYLFSNSPVEDKYTEYLQGQADFYCNIANLPLNEKALTVWRQELDILVDLAGHSRDNGLAVLSYKPAPVQVSGIGYFATTGLSTVDYFLSDKYLVNNEDLSEPTVLADENFVEKLLVLPHSHFCYEPLKDMPPEREAPCRANGYITFGSFNNLSKVNDTVLSAWGKILAQVPHSRLILKCGSLDDEDMRSLFTEKLLSLGIGEDRFELRGFSADYLVEYYDIDIALDTFPYPGGGTTCDALYMGVPVVSLGNGSHGGNFGVSLLKNIGLEIFCSSSIEEFINKAVLLASDRELINALHLGLRKMMKNSPIMNKELYTRELEQGYKKIWQDFINIA